MRQTRFKELYTEYNNRQAIIKNNRDIAERCYKDIQIMKKALDPKTVGFIDTYHPGLLDMLNLSDNPSTEELIKLKDSIDFVYDTLCDIAEQELG